MLNFPLSHADFLANYFEQKPVFCSGALRESLLQWQDIDALLNTQEPDERRMQMFLNGQVPPPHFLDDVFEFGRAKKRINKDRFYKLLQHGATLVINQAEDISTPVKRLCAEIGKFAHQTTSCNAYMSAGAAGTFGKHWDTHDVFAVQIIGKKRWQLFEPTLPLPLSHQTSSKLALQSNFAPPSGTPDFECIMCEGDLLYVPRGWWHEVTPVTGESLHLSIGTYPPTTLDYVMWICKTQLPQLLAARKSCDASADNPALAQVMLHLMEEAINQNNLNSFNSTHRAVEKLNGEFHTELALQKSSFSDDLELSLASVYALAPNTSEIAVNDIHLNLNLSGRALVGLLQKNGTLSWSEVRNQLSEIPDASLKQTVLDLNRYELIHLHTPNHSKN